MEARESAFLAKLPSEARGSAFLAKLSLARNVQYLLLLILSLILPNTETFSRLSCTTRPQIMTRRLIANYEFLALA